MRVRVTRAWLSLRSPPRAARGPEGEPAVFGTVCRENAARSIARGTPVGGSADNLSA